MQMESLERMRAMFPDDEETGQIYEALRLFCTCFPDHEESRRISEVLRLVEAATAEERRQQ
jgi:hypothetical protein